MQMTTVREGRRDIVDSSQPISGYLVITSTCGVLSTFLIDYTQSKLRKNLDAIRIHQQQIANGSKAENP